MSAVGLLILTADVIALFDRFSEAAACDQLGLGFCWDYGIILVVPLILVTTGRIEYALQNRPLPDRRLVLRGFLHGRRLGDRRLARRANLLRDLNKRQTRLHSGADKAIFAH